MIDIRELRNKNWVMYHGEQRQIGSTHVINNKVGLIVKGCDKIVSRHWMEINCDIEPIPFTTEWAQRFGLIGRIINGLCISESEYQGHEYDLCLYDEHTWDSERRVICPIHYVHQCQNIFLDLAGHIIE